MAETTADVRRDIELTRERMSSTLAELENKLNVMQIVRDHPWPALALAVGAGVLRGLGDTRVPLIAMLSGYWMIGVPVSLVLGFRSGLGPRGLWWGFVAGRGGDFGAERADDPVPRAEAAAGDRPVEPVDEPDGTQFGQPVGGGDGACKEHGGDLGGGQDAVAVQPVGDLPVPVGEVGLSGQDTGSRADRAGGGRDRRRGGHGRGGGGRGHRGGRGGDGRRRVRGDGVRCGGGIPRRGKSGQPSCRHQPVLPALSSGSGQQ